MIEILLSGNKETNCVMVAYDKKLMCIQKEIDEDVYVNINGRRILVDREKDSCIGTMGETKVYMKLDELIKLANTEVKTYAEELEQQYNDLKEKYANLEKEVKTPKIKVKCSYEIPHRRRFVSKKDALNAEHKTPHEIIEIKRKPYFFVKVENNGKEDWNVLRIKGV